MRIPVQKAGAAVEFTLGPWVKGINEKSEAGALAADELRAAENVLLDEKPGQVVKRFGNTVEVTLPSGNPAKFAYDFKKNDGTEYLLLSDGETIYVTEDLVSFTTLIGSLDDTAYLQFETDENKCWITNGTDATMWFDGTNLVVMDREYGAAGTATTETGTDQTHIVDADLTQASDYWNNRRVVITSGDHAGMEGLVTDFDAATDKLTISGFDNDPGVGVTYMVGLEMPKGRIIRRGPESLFIGCTSENRSEVRFPRLDDPDTGLRMSVDNPRAWPTDYQVSITQDDGDQVWTFSPCYRDRVLVSKGNAIYRLEPNSTYYYKPVLVSQEVGCRYPDCWAVKDDLLHFIGNERSGLVDLYVTDMVGVRPKHRDGRLMPSFEEMQRSEPVYRYIARASADQFNTGEKSTLCETGNGRLECKLINTKTGWSDIISAYVDCALRDQTDGSIGIDGKPAWQVKYEANELPTAATPVWSVLSEGPAYAPVITAGKLILLTGEYPHKRYYKNDVYDSSKNTFVAFRIKAEVPWVRPVVSVQNGTKLMNVEFISGRIYINGVNIAACDISDYKTFGVLLDTAGNGRVYQDGVRVWTGTAAAAAAYGGYWTANSIVFGGMGTAGNAYTYWDYIYEDADFAYDAATLPATLDTAASVTVKLDYTREPDAFGKFWLTLGNDFEGTAEAGTDATHIVDADLTGEDDFWNDRQVTITDGTYEGDTGTVTAYDSAAHKLTISGLAGDPGVGATFQLDRLGTVAIETSSSADDVTYDEPAALENGQEPGVDNATAHAQYLKITFTLTAGDYVQGPELKALTGGFKWRMTGQRVGASISAWRNYIDDITVPAGTGLVTKIRLATVATEPVEGDWGDWQTITTGQNIGTILSDTPPPAAGESRWLDVTVEGNPSAFGVSPSLENFLLNWREGASSRLLITAFMYKKRYYLTGISSSAEYNNLVFVLDTQQAWVKFTGQNLNRIFSFKGLIYGLASDSENIYQLEVDGLYSDNETAVAATIDTGILDFGNQRFALTNVKVGNGAVISNVAVYLSYDEVTWTLIGTLVFTGEGTQNLRVPHGRISKRHAVRLVVAAAEAMAINMLKVAGTVKAED